MADKVQQQEHQAVSETPAASQEVQANDQVVAPEDVAVEETYQLTVKVPGQPGEIKIIASPREAIQDIKQSIMESPETCAHSCFYLAFQGKRLNDFGELGEVEGITTESVLELVEDKYTERDVRLHINRLRDLLGGPYKPNPSAVGIDPALSFLTAVTGEIDEEIITEGEKKMEDLFSDEPVPEHAFTHADLKARAQLSDFVPSTFQRYAPQCIKSLALSGWNPVPHSQRLKGDLMYIIVTTLENEILHITASVNGFFVNKSSSTKFDPAPRAGPKSICHSLITLLQKVSPSFATNFTKVQDFITRHHMLEVLPVNTYYPSYPWAVQPPQPTYDPARPAEALLNFGTDAVESLRDWNDELQSHRELPKSNLQERVLRERLINKVQSEFTDAAVSGAMAVVNGSVVPLNPMEPEESHMYVYNNIFFSKGNDGRGTFEALGADEAAHVATGKDLEGVKILNSIDPEGLYTLGSVIVDYKGVRIVAQSIVPGIFRRQDDNSIVYGSVDNGSQISADEKFHEIIGNEVAKSLHLAEHTLVDAEDKKTRLYTSLETKGLLGADGRRYLLDLYRLNPVDIVFQENEGVATEGENAKPAYPHKMTLLRPELMSLFWERKFRDWVKQKSEALKKERAEQKQLQGDAEKPAEEKKEQDQVVEKTEEAKEGEQAAEEEEEIKIDVSEFQLSFNPDVFTGAKQPEGKELDEIKNQETVIRDASKFLNDEILPSLVLDFASYSISPLDGDALTKAMHRRGINMRYLGKLAELVSVSQDKRIDHIHHLAIQEMIVRACKRMLRNYLLECALDETSLCVSHFFNCLMGGDFNPKPAPVLPEGKIKNDFKWAGLTPASLKHLLKEQVLLRFRYKLTDDDLANLKILPTLREVCLRVGIQMEARNYRFHAYTEEEKAAIAAEDAAARSQADRQKQLQNKSSRKTHKKSQKEDQRATVIRRKTTFIPEDVFNVMPTVKQASTRSLFAEETFEAGKMSLAQGHRQLGLELLLESLTLHEQTYGFLHPETSKCYATLAMIYHHDEDREAALDLQRKAVIAAERTCGVDHPETIHHYLNLGLFEHAAGRTKLGLRYLRHALFYWDLLFGPGHPDSATADNNAGVMLQSLRDYTVSTVFFERACATQESILGKEHVITATGYHVLAKAYTLQGDFTKALNAERTAYNVFEKKLGVEDPRTKESDMWLKELTSNALLTAQRAREHEAKAKDLPAAAAAAAAAATARATKKKIEIPKGELPLEEVLKYINGDAQASARKGKKKAQKNRQ
ncbi:clustered mitochondria-domain-containing protein [Radiomyces spectabilis]|uniref:clustered mitochondria-domain-containing protein n=1 Tax=Radiomyces spectabilis TaxID=64574 RepID=UPI00221EBF41|nr:clustered mitochondria-domain-containing protein [Radiomyces spectabilis]KAI8393980.1 clustered mitochondria-domain-containing protein [Radiomyces spectabilis]